MSAKKRILFLTKRFPPYHGGVSSYSYNLLASSANIDSTVIAAPATGRESFVFPSNMNVIDGACYPPQYDIHFTFKWVYSFFAMTALISKTVIKHNIDCIVVGQAEHFLVLTSFLAGLITGKPRIQIFHGEDIPQIKRKSNAVFKFIHRRAIIHICNSMSSAKRLMAFCDIKLDDINIIYPGVESKFFNAPNQSAIAEIKNKYSLHNKKVIYTIARLSKSKGHDIAVKAMSLIIRKHPNVVYVIGGMGNEFNNISKLIDEYGLQTYILMAGRILGNSIVAYQYALPQFRFHLNYFY